MTKPLVLCILDGCGIRKETDGNAFANANKPTFDRYILKAIVPSNFKTSLLRELDNLGINEKNLFPGLDSIGKYINSVFTPGYRLYD